MRIRRLLFFFLFLTCFANAQQAAHFLFGENQFRGVQIYDVIQDKNLNYWFATNEGLFFFNYYSYEKIECAEAKSHSVFNFVINADGDIFCHNLNNQIFKIEGKECRLFYELQSDEGTADMSLSVGDDDNLLIGAKKIIVLNKEGVVRSKFDTEGRYLGQPFCTPEKNILFHINGNHSVLVYSKGKFTKHTLIFDSEKIPPSSVLKFFKIKTSIYGIDLKTKALYRFNYKTFKIKILPKNSAFGRSESVRIYETGNEIWVAGTLPGTILLNEKNIETNNEIYYKDYFVSDVFKNNEGSFLVSTFDKGVIVIPDLNVPDVINSFKEDPIVSFYSDKQLGLILGSSKGKLMNYNKGHISDLNTKGTRPIEGIYGEKNSTIIVYDDGHIRAYNKQTNKIINIVEASLKDAVFVSKNEFYLGTNSGIINCIWDEKNTISYTWSKDMNYRIYALAYDTMNNVLYAATSNGLFYISTNNKKQIICQEKVVFPNSLFFNEGKLYATDKKNNVLVIEKDVVAKTIQPFVNGNAEALNKIVIYNNTIITKSSNGLFQFDMKGRILKTIHSDFGFSQHRVLDFTFHNNEFWVSHAGGVQQIDLNYAKSNLKTPNLHFDKVLVNDSITNSFNQEKFNSTKRKFEFILSCPTILKKEGIHYHYTLVGYENKWNNSNYELNKITYNALGPGDYTFIAKTECRGEFSKPIFYSFTIMPPFYARWWFVTTCIALFLLIVWLVYRWQLAIQRKKSEQINELNASKLTAIQSQMNPHFIFNSLNSIQDLVLKGDVENSYSYITTFSNLVRRTLNYSEKDFIDFEQEIKLLELYLSLEKLRFKKDFNYTIECIGIQDIMIPPLLVQPFIENSLVHGLLHKDGQKNLKITFELADVLICTIEDNGVGREKAKAIKQRQRSEHESFSGKAIHKRFEILSNVFDGEFGYAYEDLVENGTPCGTKVILKIPVKHKF